MFNVYELRIVALVAVQSLIFTCLPVGRFKVQDKNL